MSVPVGFTFGLSLFLFVAYVLKPSAARKFSRRDWMWYAHRIRETPEEKSEAHRNTHSENS